MAVNQPLQPKQLLNPLGLVLTPSSSIKSDNSEINSLEKHDYLKQDCEHVRLEDSIYSSTSQMLSENELLITLPYDRNDRHLAGEHLSFIEHTDYQNDVSNTDSNLFEREYKQLTYDKNGENPNANNIELIMDNADSEIDHNIRNNTSVRILKILSLTNSNEVDENMDNTTDSSVIFEEISSTEIEIHDIKTLTVLSNVEVNNINCCEEVNKSNSELISDSMETQSGITENEISNSGKCEENAKMKLHTSDQEKSTHHRKSLKSTQSFIKKIKKHIRQKMWDTKTQPKSRLNNKAQAAKRVKKKTKGFIATDTKTGRKSIIDLEKLTPLTENAKQNPVVQTYVQKKKTNNKGLNQKLYQKILPPNKEQIEEEEPNEFSVFEFYDEEDEKRKVEKMERDKEKQLIKERTCLYCKEVFKDPIDVLRHKREVHTPRKVHLSKEELEPYLQLESRTHCPLCFKGICPNGYKSLYVKHIMTHCKTSSFCCKVCGIKFRRKDHMQTHEKRHIVPPE